MKAPFEKDNIKVAVIGGGTGSFMLLSALKNHTSRVAALVNMADDGGSTGQLRDELGDWVRFVLIDRLQPEAITRHRDNFVSINSLKELIGL